MCIGSGCGPAGVPGPACRRSPCRRRLFAVTRSAPHQPALPCAPQLAVRAVAAEAASSTTGQPHGRVFNFSAGPAVLPLEVLEQAQADLVNWRGSGEAHRAEGQSRGAKHDLAAHADCTSGAMLLPAGLPGPRACRTHLCRRTLPSHPQA